ncbi:uncharacterized protein LOC134281487 [Saccostrea cucullata]|uniref:uncharacterized protein LOC134281487 n=1 Tax=Saccostrea cuccullata TaxID=36930 RepID=UPI002ED62771
MKVRRLLCNVEIALVNVILLIHYADSMSECPVNDGYVRRGPICCKSVKCKINHDYILCNGTTELGQDQCVPCPKGTVNLDAIDTKDVDYHIEVCRKPDCVCGPEEAKLINPAECMVTGRKMCECDRDRGFCGHDPMICQLSQKPEQPLGKGIELTQDCTFEPCKPGFFKEKKGLGKCEKHQECPQGFITTFNGSSIKNRECEPEREVVSDFTVKPNTSDTRSSSKSDSHSWSLSTILILIIIIAVITFLVCASICCFYIRKRLSSGDQSICVHFAQKLRLVFSSRANIRNEGLERKNEDEEQSLILDPNPQVPANTTTCVIRVGGQEDESQQNLQATVPTQAVQNVCETNDQPSMEREKQYSNEVTTASVASSSLPVLSSESLQTSSLDKVKSGVHSEKPCAFIHSRRNQMF